MATVIDTHSIINAGGIANTMTSGLDGLPATLAASAVVVATIAIIITVIRWFLMPEQTKAGAVLSRTIRIVLITSVVVFLASAGIDVAISMGYEVLPEAFIADKPSISI